MRREYDWESNPDDKNTQKLGDSSWIGKQQTGLGSKGQKQSPKFAPFYLGVRNDLDSAASKRILKTLAVPSFADERNEEFMKVILNNAYEAHHTHQAHSSSACAKQIDKVHEPSILIKYTHQAHSSNTHTPNLYARRRIPSFGFQHQELAQKCTWIRTVCPPSAST
jgi:hypothetical protein